MISDGVQTRSDVGTQGILDYKEIELKKYNVRFKLTFQDANSPLLAYMPLSELDPYLRVALTYTDKLNAAIGGVSKAPTTKEYKLKDLDVAAFPKDVLPDGTEISLVAKCKLPLVHCFEFDLDDEVKISESLNGIIQKELKLEIVRCDQSKFSGCTGVNQVKDKVEDILLNIEAFYETLDFGITGGAKPVKVDSDTITYHSLNNRDVKTNKAFFRQN